MSRQSIISETVPLKMHAAVFNVNILPAGTMTYQHRGSSCMPLRRNIIASESIPPDSSFISWPTPSPPNRHVKRTRLSISLCWLLFKPPHSFSIRNIYFHLCGSHRPQRMRKDIVETKGWKERHETDSEFIFIWNRLTVSIFYCIVMKACQLKSLKGIWLSS